MENCKRCGMMILEHKDYNTNIVSRWCLNGHIADVSLENPNSPDIRDKKESQAKTLKKKAKDVPGL